MQKKSKFSMFTLMMLIILGLTFQPAISTYAVCPDDITAYWKLDDTTAGTYADFIKDNDGTSGAADPTLVPAPGGVVNGAQAFDGTAEINVPANYSFDWAADDSFSIEFWVKRDGAVTVEQVAIGRDDPTTQFRWWAGIEPTANAASFVLRDSLGASPTLVGTTDITDNKWHHVVAVRDSSDIPSPGGQNLLYVDGKLDVAALPATYTTGFFSTADLNIGYWNFDSTPSNHLVGILDEVALYDRALTPDEIEDHYDAGLLGQDYCLGSAPFVPFPDDTISLWHLDELTLTPGDTGGIYEDSFDGNDGAGNPNPTAVPAPGGRVNGAQAFDGTGIPSTQTEINVPADGSFDWAADDSFSIEFWVKRDGAVTVEQVAIGRDDPTTQFRWWAGIEPTANAASFFVLRDSLGASPTLVGTTDITDNKWHHVVAVRDRSLGDDGQNLLYVDGKPDTAAPLDAAYTTGFFSTADLNIGYWNFNGTSSNHLTGMLDEVALYDRALTPDEIQEHYDAGLAGNGVQSLRPPPVADAGDDKANVIENTEVTLVGSDSVEGYAAAPITTYLWEQTAGTDVGTITDADKITATFDAPDFVAAGQPLTFQLTVTASDGQSDSDTVDVGVVDRIPPVADAGVSQNVTEGATVTLDGTGSSDADGTIVSYLWEEVTTTGVTINNDTTTPTATFTAPDVDAAGATLTFKLTVTDDDDLTDSATTTVTVSDSPIAPSADAGADQNVTEGDPVTLNGTGSTGTGLTFAWSPSTGSGWALSDATAESPTFTAPDVDAAGAILTFQLTVTDNLGATSSDDVNVNVADASSPLQAVAGDDQTVTVGDTVTLDSTGSTGPIASYAWEQVIIADESRVQLSNADTPIATFIAPDASASDDVAAALLETLTFQLTVTDNTGAESSDTVEVNIDDGTSTRSGGGGGGGGGCFINSMF